MDAAFAQGVQKLAKVNGNRLAMLVSAFYSTALKAVVSLNKSVDSAHLDSFQCHIVKLVSNMSCKRGVEHRDDASTKGRVEFFVFLALPGSCACPLLDSQLSFCQFVDL